MNVVAFIILIMSVILALSAQTAVQVPSVPTPGTPSETPSSSPGSGVVQLPGATAPSVPTSSRNFTNNIVIPGCPVADALINKSSGYGALKIYVNDSLSIFPYVYEVWIYCEREFCMASMDNQHCVGGAYKQKVVDSFTTINDPLFGVGMIKRYGDTGKISRDNPYDMSYVCNLKVCRFKTGVCISRDISVLMTTVPAGCTSTPIFINFG